LYEAPKNRKWCFDFSKSLYLPGKILFILWSTRKWEVVFWLKKAE